MAKKHEISLVRSSAAEYLTFVAAAGEGGVQAAYADENVWLTQKMLAQSLRCRNPHHQLPPEKGVR